MAESSRILSDLRRHERPLVLVADLLHGDLLDGVCAQAEKQGWRLRELEYSRYIIPETPLPIGAIVGKNPEIVKALQRLNVPIVRPGGWPSEGLPCVQLDLEASGQMAADFFAERGYRNVGYVGQAGIGAVDMPYGAFKKRTEAHGNRMHLLELRPSPLETKELKTFDDRMELHKDKERQIADWLRRAPKPLALFAYNDHFAGTLCIVAESLDLSVPEDIAILGRNNIQRVCELAPVPLSSIQENVYDQGRQSVLLLQRLIDGGRPPLAPIMIPPVGVVERRSTNILAVDDRRVAQALRFMWDNLDVQLSVDDIALEIGVSRSTLERLFGKYLDRGVNAELKRKRLEYCGELLRSTEMTFEQITRAVGYLSVPSLHRVFVESFGVTPTAYRKQVNEKN